MLGCGKQRLTAPVIFYQLGLITFSRQMRTRTRKMRTHARTKLLSVERRGLWSVVT